MAKRKLFPSADLMFGYDYCPVVRQLRGRRNDKLIGVGFSLFAHLCLLIIGGIAFIKPVEFGVDQGLSGMEVQLVAGSDEAVAAIPDPVKEEEPKPVVQPEEIIEQPKPEPVKSSTLGNSPVNAFSTGHGAIVEAEPSYLKNPAPQYPFKARQNGWEGLVVLRTIVDKNGAPVKVEIEKTSGHSVLDEAALKTVKTWRFRPAQLGSLTVESSVQVPVRFELENLNRK